MRIKALCPLFCTFAGSILGTATATSAALKRSQTSVDSFIATEVPIAESGVFANIGPNGAKALGAATGVVVASPSKSNPDYFFVWTRDASLTFQALIERFVGGEASLETQIKNFITSVGVLQHVTNPSGGPTTGGLGEPKFNVNETEFTGFWGRPQRDGPALRATALITYANAVYLDETRYITNTVWPLIQNDLNYLVANWNQTGYDLWEEVPGSSFFTIAVQHRALRLGHTFSSHFGTPNATYSTSAQNVLCFLQYFWNGAYVTANINVNNGRTGKDANTILGSIHTFDPDNLSCDELTFQPCSSLALANHKVVVDSFRFIYTINSGISEGTAVAVGRYPEDSYYGGNPWYLNTLAAAEQLYDALYVWNKAGALNVTSTSLAFFKDFSSSIIVGTYSSNTSTYSTLMSAIKTYADSFVAVVQKYTPSNGSFSEQYSKSDGTPLSAYDLTWSYASFLTMSDRRSGSVPPSWGSSGLTSCSSGGGSTVLGTFDVSATTRYGQEVYITDDVVASGNWSTSVSNTM